MAGRVITTEEKLKKVEQHLRHISVNSAYYPIDTDHPIHVRKGVVKYLFDMAGRVTTTEEKLKKAEQHLKHISVNSAYYPLSLTCIMQGICTCIGSVR